MDDLVVPAPDSVAKSANKNCIFNTPVDLKDSKTVRPNSNVKKSLCDETTPESPKSLINSTPKHQNPY